jgi:quercetin dioxygenase-like cupin family protein
MTLRAFTTSPSDGDSQATIPEFVREALASDDTPAALGLADSSELIHGLAGVLPASVPPAPLRAQLLDELSRPPERYACFGRALTELFELSRAEVTALLLQSADDAAWQRSGLPGIRTLPVTPGPSVGAAQAYLVRFRAGVRFPAHRHEGREQVLLLAGEYTDDTGRTFRTGDTHIMEPGTEHALTIAREEDCVAATLLVGKLNFRSLPLRLLARLLGY